MHILLAEDDKVSRMILETQLKGMKHTFVSTVDGVELLETFRKTPDAYDAIITDIMMPNMNGLEATREIKKLKNISVVALTAVDQDTKILDNNGNYIPWSTCDYFLRKPTKAECIMDVLSNVDYDNYIRNKNKGT